MTKQELQAQIDKHNTDISAIFRKADDEKRPTSTEELAQISDLEGKIDAAKASIKQVEDAEQARLRHQQRLADEAKGKGRRTEHDSTATHADGIGEVRDAFINDPKKGFKTHVEFLTLVMDAPRKGRVDDARLKYLAAGSDEQGTYSDPYGGFLLPSGFTPNLLSLATETDPIASRTTKVPMATATVELPARVDKNHTSSVSGGLRVYRRVETDTAASSRMEFERVKLQATMLTGVAYATEEVLARSPISFLTLLQAGFGDEFAAKLIKERLFGTGAGEFEGVVNSPCVVSVAKETGQAAATLVYENIIKMRARVWGYANAIWLANHDCVPQLMLMNQSVGTGGMPVWQPSAREDHPDMLLGRPLFFSEFAETIGTTGDIICGNWSQYLEGTLTPVQSAESMHVRFLEHERTFKFWTENDGRCWWRTALTPNQSSSTLSPFVKLDARA